MNGWITWLQRALQGRCDVSWGNTLGGRKEKHKKYLKQDKGRHLQWALRWKMLLQALNLQLVSALPSAFFRIFIYRNVWTPAQLWRPTQPPFWTNTLHKRRSLTRPSLHTIMTVPAITTMWLLVEQNQHNNRTVSLSISVWGKSEVSFFFFLFL